MENLASPWKNLAEPSQTIKNYPKSSQPIKNDQKTIPDRQKPSKTITIIKKNGTEHFLGGCHVFLIKCAGGGACRVCGAEESDHRGLGPLHQTAQLSDRSHQLRRRLLELAHVLHDPLLVAGPLVVGRATPLAEHLFHFMQIQNFNI